MSTPAAIEAQIGRVILQVLFMKKGVHTFESLRNRLNELSDPPLWDSPIESSEVVRALMALDRKVRAIGLALDYIADGVQLVSGEPAHAGLAGFHERHGESKLRKRSSDEQVVMMKVALDGPIAISKIEEAFGKDLKRVIQLLEREGMIMVADRSAAKPAYIATSKFYEVFKVDSPEELRFMVEHGCRPGDPSPGKTPAEPAIEE